MGKKRQSENERLRIVLGTLIGIRECLRDAMDFVDRGIGIVDYVLLSDEPLQGRSATTPFGYRKDDKGSLVEDKVEQSVLRVIRQEFSKGHPPRKICTELNARGFRNRHKRWTGKTVSELTRAIMARK